MSADAAWQPSLAEIAAARRAAVGVVKVTPVFSFGELSRRCRGEVAIKAENLQRTGSFKLRGTLSKLRLAGDESAGVVAGSAGNHGQALAYAARARGLPCTVFMPESAAVSKVEAVVAFGAGVRQEGGSVDDCIAAARRYAEQRGWVFVHPFDDPAVITGQAGLGAELAEQVPDLGKVIVPVGGGGLIGGVAAALRQLRPEVEIAGVQAAGCRAFEPSLRAGRPVSVAAPSTIADGIAVKRPGALTLGLVERLVDEMAAVEDAAIAEAMVFLAERAKLVVEGAGAVAVAALASGAVAPAASGTTVAILSGGNVDGHVLAAALDRHQTGIGRRLRLFTRISDRPGGLAGLLAAVAATGASVIDVSHLRDGIDLDPAETGVEILVETRSQADARRLTERLRADGYAVEARR